MTTQGPNPPQFDSGTERLRGEGDCNDVVMSSRARLARNIAGFPFAAKSTSRDRQQTLDLCRSWCRSNLIGASFHVGGPPRFAPGRTNCLFQRHLYLQATQQGQIHRRRRARLGKTPGRRNFPPRPAPQHSTPVNEEDHLRVQVIRSGLALSECWSSIDQVDDKIEVAGSPTPFPTALAT